MTDYSKLSLVELRLAAKKLGIKSVTSYKKLELLAKVNEVAAQMEKEETVEDMADDTQKETVMPAAAMAMQTATASSQSGSISQDSRGGYVRGNQDMGRMSYGRSQDNDHVGYSRSYNRNNQDMGRMGYNNQNNMRGGYNQGYNNRGNQEGYRGGYSRDNQEGYRSSYNQNYNRGNQDHYDNHSNYRYDNRNQNYDRNQGYDNRNQGYDRNQNNYDRNQNYDNRNQNNYDRNQSYNRRNPNQELTPTEIAELDSGINREGILEVLPEGYGFVRCDNFLPGENDVYVAPFMIRKYGLRTGDILNGNLRIRNHNEKFAAMLYLKEVNGVQPDMVIDRPKFEQLTPVFPDERMRLETPGCPVSMRMMDLIAPIGKGQRGMIVSQPKTGKTTLLKQVAKAVKTNHPKIHLLVLLIDERPEEVTDIKESIMGHNVDVIYSTFDELPENHKRVSEMVIERAKRLVEQGEEVMILLDSITRLARAYNLTVQPSGRTLSGGLDPAALHMPKKFFGAARNIREGGSLTILATALVDTGSKMDDVVFEEFKGTGNMELVLDRKLSEKRVFPAIDLPRSSTRRDDLLLTQDEVEANYLMRRALGSIKGEEAVERIIEVFRKTKSNQEFIDYVRKNKIV